MTASKLTPARQRGLAVLLASERTGRDVLYSNTTTALDQLDRTGRPRDLTVYWQTADWLEHHNLIRPRHGTVLLLTPTGRHLATQHHHTGHAAVANGEAEHDQ